MIRIFFSYAREDETLREQLEVHLASLRRLGLTEDWHDGKIGAGVEWDEEISQRLEASDIIVLLVSPDFIASDYIYENELEHALERHRARTARVIPVILRPCNWKGQSFGGLQATPPKGKPVVKFVPRDEGFVKVTEAIESAVRELGKTDGASTRPDPLKPSSATSLPATAPPDSPQGELPAPTRIENSGAAGASQVPMDPRLPAPGSPGAGPSTDFSRMFSSIPSALLAYLKDQAPWLLPVFIPLTLVVAASFADLSKRGYEAVLGVPLTIDVSPLQFLGKLFELPGNIPVLVMTAVSVGVLIYAVVSRHGLIDWRPRGSLYLILLGSAVALTLASLPCLLAPWQINGIDEQTGEGITKTIDYSPRFPACLPVIKGHCYDKIFSWYYGVDPDKGRETVTPDPDQVKKLGEHFGLLAAFGIWGALWLATLLTLKPVTRPSGSSTPANDRRVIGLLIVLSVIVAIQWIALIADYGRLVLAGEVLVSKARLLSGQDPDYFTIWPRSQMYFRRPPGSDDRVCIENQWPHELDETELLTIVTDSSCGSTRIDGSLNDEARNRLYCERSIDRTGKPMYTDGELAYEAGLVGSKDAGGTAKWPLSKKLEDLWETCEMRHDMQKAELWLEVIPAAPEADLTAAGIDVIVDEIVAQPGGGLRGTVRLSIAGSP